MFNLIISLLLAIILFAGIDTMKTHIHKLEHRIDELEQCIAEGNKDNPICPQIDAD